MKTRIQTRIWHVLRLPLRRQWPSQPNLCGHRTWIRGWSWTLSNRNCRVVLQTSLSVISTFGYSRTLTVFNLLFCFSHFEIFLWILRSCVSVNLWWVETFGYTMEGNTKELRSYILSLTRYLYSCCSVRLSTRLMITLIAFCLDMVLWRAKLRQRCSISTRMVVEWTYRAVGYI